MPAVRKPVVLDETGRISNQKIEDIGNEIDADRESIAQGMTALGDKIETSGETLAQGMAVVGDKITESAVAITEKINTLPSLIPPIISAMDRLDIIYYVED